MSLDMTTRHTRLVILFEGYIPSLFSFVEIEYERSFDQCQLQFIATLFVNIMERPIEWSGSSRFHFRVTFVEGLRPVFARGWNSVIGYRDLERGGPFHCAKYHRNM